MLFHLQTNLYLLYQSQSVWTHTVPFLCCTSVSAWNYKRHTEGAECIDVTTVLRHSSQTWGLMCSPVKHFRCLEAASWLCADPSQSRVETPPPRCEWGNTWSQQLQPGSWVGFPAVSRRRLFTYSSVRIRPDVLDSTWFPGITPPQKAVSTKHFPLASLSFSLKWSRVVVGGMLFLIWEKSHILFKEKPYDLLLTHLNHQLVG